jgi:hypothetical protein
VHVVNRVVVLGDAERPTQLRALGRRVLVGELLDDVRGNTGDLFGVLERVRLDRPLVSLEPGRRALDEGPVLETVDDDLAADRVRQGNIRADVDPEPDVGPLRRARATRVDDVQARAVADAFEEVMEEDRMRLARIRAPEDDEIGVLDLLV